MRDRNGEPLAVLENNRGHRMLEITSLPPLFEELLLDKEDSYYYWHFGINPIRTIIAVWQHCTGKPVSGASTITQQLAKNLLGNETSRTWSHKLYELLYAIGLEAVYSKEEILIWYANTVYLGNQSQGFETAAQMYFNTSLAEATESQYIALLASLSRPNVYNPWKPAHVAHSEYVAHVLRGPSYTYFYPSVSSEYSFYSPSYFEIRTSNITCSTNCNLTVDGALTEKIRNIVQRITTHESERGARHAAVVVIDPKNSTVLALVGSPDPKSDTAGNQINMTREPRPIGSTVKPLLYLKGFMEGLRPYTLVDDREYKYGIATGFSLYPKNYDGQYNGEVTLNYALSNSLNTPSVRVLEYIGLPEFYTFLDQDLKFLPIREYDSYQYGIALGGLDMDLTTLTHYMTVFPRLGTIAPLSIGDNSVTAPNLTPQSHILTTRTISSDAEAGLVHAILSDRQTGAAQFGITSNLSLPFTGYGVKTGTSRDYHDSWVVGYTNEYVVGVWLGNTENEALAQVSGQSGAGAIWKDVMNLMHEYSATDTSINLPKEVTLLPFGTTLEWGLDSDDTSKHRTLLKETSLIVSPHSDDTFAYLAEGAIPLRASEPVQWSYLNQTLGTGDEISFHPPQPGEYVLSATSESGETATVRFLVTP